VNIIVFSDSHGDAESMRLIIEKSNPDMVIYLGDGIGDILKLQKEFSQLRFEYVKGNCDIITQVPKEILITVDGFTFLLMHGDKYGYRLDSDIVVEYAREKGATLFLHGHTHTPTIWTDSGITVMNPGTVRNKPGKSYPTYGLIRTSEFGFSCKIMFAAYLLQ